MKNVIIKKLQQEFHLAKESCDFHRKGGNKYGLASYFDGKKDEIRSLKKFIKNLKEEPDKRTTLIDFIRWYNKIYPFDAHAEWLVDDFIKDEKIN